MILISALSLSLLGLASGRLYYMLWTTIIALLFAAILVFAVSCNEIGSGFARLVRPVALASYSIYLVHPLALHVAQIASKGHVAALYFSVAAALVVGSAAMFYLAVARTSIAIRDRRWPRRTAQSGAELQSIRP